MTLISYNYTTGSGTSRDIVFNLAYDGNLWFAKTYWETSGGIWKTGRSWTWGELTRDSFARLRPEEKQKLFTKADEDADRLFRLVIGKKAELLK